MNIYDKTFKKLLDNIAKRLLILIAKLLGFKAFCLFLTTILLKSGLVSKEEWLTVMITIVCSASGIHIADNFSIANRTGGKNVYPKKNYYGSTGSSSNSYYGRSGTANKAKQEASEKIRDLCKRAAAELD